MRKDELTLRLARSTQVTPAQAADQLDAVVHDILLKLRQGKAAKLPGLGKLCSDGNSGIKFTSEPKRGGRK